MATAYGARFQATAPHRLRRFMHRSLLIGEGKLKSKQLIGAVASLSILFTLAATAAGQGKTENVILITLDGARTQEVFGGLDLEVLKSKTKKGSVEDTPLYKKYYAETPEERREKLMPFFWGALMKQHGSIAGNRSLGST